MSDAAAIRRRANRAKKGEKTYSVHGKPTGRKPKPLDAPVGPPPAKAFHKGVVQNPKGRPEVYGDEVRQRILDLLWSGECKSLVAVSRLDGMPTCRTIDDWCRKYPEFAEELAKARLWLGEHYLDDIHQMNADVRAGTLDPTAGNVVIRSTQWLATVTDPRTFSTKSYIDKKETIQVTTTRIDRIEIYGLDDDQLDAIEAALNAKLLTGPIDGGAVTAGED
jgi:terminase small subunit-like protein